MAKISIGADHGGYKIKEKIKSMLEKQGHTMIDVGTDSSDSCDYPVYGYKAAEMVSKKKTQKGIAICKSGIGMSMVANKLPGVRAALCTTVKDASSAREHNDANMLTLGASRVSEKLAIAIAKKWVKTKFLKGRHARRVNQMKKIEKKLYKKF